MRRDLRRKQQKMQRDKIIVYSSIGVIVLLTVVFTLLTFGTKSNDNQESSRYDSEQIADIIGNKTNVDTESASSSIGKSIEEQEIKEDKREEKKEEKKETKEQPKEQKATKETKKENKNETKKELSFQKPVEGEITQGFAKENLVYSETLQEWVTHNGIDIKAEKATVVQAAEDGVVKSIKNDPRYGLTIIIEHSDGFQTVYANLLSTEFVSQGENVVKGQSIGTVGNTAVFESADEPHLHFEILKDSVQIDPSIYMK